MDLNRNDKTDATSINGSYAYFNIGSNDWVIRKHMGRLGRGYGFLVKGLNDNSKIDGISELFGSYTVNAFDDLESRIDSNGDGIIDAKDDLFNTLQVRIDENGNGITDRG